MSDRCVTIDFLFQLCWCTGVVVVAGGSGTSCFTRPSTCWPSPASPWPSSPSTTPTCSTRCRTHRTRRSDSQNPFQTSTHSTPGWDSPPWDCSPYRYTFLQYFLVRIAEVHSSLVWESQWQENGWNPKKNWKESNCTIIIFKKKKFEIMCHIIGCNDSSG